MDHNVGAAYLEEALRSVRGHKRLAEGAFVQLRDEDFFLQLDDEANSIAILIKHLAGKAGARLQRGDRVRIESPGGGGYGRR